ncbi:hypothetical protein ABZ816_21720 [Actinosynnema sp. NPDC047251]|uniref:Uncharacterized protein n=1 Tax=Saccharothrix espanaensis (strain ATCC 51144 / DSM 44229 / JCM 9112 / NBRC 15066 / NRRL 15764) TaxID=1179773 RepID=K0K8B4_SACES|nr:hypothetical protein [Saccharothrix espanaensis]CCH33777.1 hypothetical protein BN6_65370 [Saccharothrix espanaensis DSM 44229]
MQSWHGVVGVDGPFASVYLDVSDHLDLRWRAVRDQLEGFGAGPGVLAVLDGAMVEATPAGMTGRALVVGDGRVLVDRFLPVPPTGYVARFGDLPYLLPMVDLSEPLLPHVVVDVGAHGAELRGVDPTGRAVAVASVGARRPDRRLDPAELADVASEATSLVDLVRAPLLVLAGTLSARRSLRVALPERYRHLVVEVEGAPDRAVAALAGRADQDGRRAVVQRFRDESARLTGRAVHGVAAVQAALEAGTVGTLLLSDPLVGSLDADGGRADEVLPLLAAASGAEVVLVGDAVRLHEDSGALLRD